MKWILPRGDRQREKVKRGGVQLGRKGSRGQGRGKRLSSNTVTE